MLSKIVIYDTLGNMTYCEMLLNYVVQKDILLTNKK